MGIFIVFAVSNILCFVIGAKIGQMVNKGDDINLNPVQMAREHKTKVEAQKAQDRMETIMQNIENYDGSSVGQRDVPRG